MNFSVLHGYFVEYSRIKDILLGDPSIAKMLPIKFSMDKVKLITMQKQEFENGDVSKTIPLFEIFRPSELLLEYQGPISSNLLVLIK